MSSASVTFVLISTALSFAMIPGLVLLHRGLTPDRLGQRDTSIVWVVTAGAVSLIWLLLGAAIVAGDPSSSDFIGIAGLAGFDASLLPLGEGFPDLADAYFLGALRTGVLVVAAAGAMSVVAASRTTHSRATVVGVVWAVLVLLPVSMWIYAVRWDGSDFVGGWVGAGLSSVVGVGALDFGGGAVHVALGSSLLALTSLGSRPTAAEAPGAPLSSGGVTLLGGAFLLWVGGVGSAAAAEGYADDVAALAVVNALCAPAAAGIAWMSVEHIRDGRSSTSGGARGVLAGVAVVSACSGFLTPMLALLLGLGMGVLGAITIRGGRSVRQSGRATALLHLVCGITGIVALGVAAQGQGILYSGSIAQLSAQLVLCVAVGGYAFLATGIIARIGCRIPFRTQPGKPAETVQEAALT